jgi:hypothetical protein
MIVYFTGRVYRDRNQSTMTEDNLGWMDFLLSIYMVVELILSVIAIQLAFRCNPQNPITFGVLAFLFPEIYLLSFLFRKYFMGSGSYCRAFTEDSSVFYGNEFNRASLYESSAPSAPPEGIASTLVPGTAGGCSFNPSSGRFAGMAMSSGIAGSCNRI